MKKRTELEGVIKRHADGFGFFIPDDAEFPDVYIPKHFMRGVMTSDRVLIEVSPEKGGDRFRGRVLDIVERGQRQAVGRFHATEDGGFVADQGHGWGESIDIPLQDCNGAKDGDMVAVEITDYPGPDSILSGRVRTVIGDIEDPMNDIRRVIHANGVIEEFDDKTLKEAKGIPDEVQSADFEGRRDLTDLDFITIDGVTAKDFDDAVYVKVGPQGFQLWVAIADVSHYVKPGSPMDQEAYSRGNSTYFPNFVVPMLPENLSNGICSLNPHVPRLALVAQMTLDYNGVVTESEFYEAVICSKSRVTYGEAQEVIDGEEMEKHQHVIPIIRKCGQLAQILLNKRMREGSLDLEIPETEMVIDEAGEPVDIIRSERLFAHRVIEEMMLVANVEVAKFLEKQDFAAFYRVHDEPDPESVELLGRFLVTFGGKRKVTGGRLQKKISKALKEFHGRPEAQILNILTLRSLSQACYSPENVGHFGLGFETYTHFTSPIRRYPDLIVHRLIKAVVHPNKGYRAMSADNLTSAGTMLSACEQRSVKAERQLNSIKKARFMMRHLGEEFEGVISSVTKFGVFVLLRTFDVDGLVKVEELGKEKFYYDENQLQLIGKRSGFVYQIGQTVKIQVAKADTETGMIDFVLSEEQILLQGEANVETAKAPARKRFKKSSKSSKNRSGSGKTRVSGRSGKSKSGKSNQRKKNRRKR